MTLLRLLGLLLLSLTVLSISAAVAHADEVEDETRRIGKQLQCPVCSGAPVSDSPSDLAGQMRSVIRSKVEAGENEAAIIAYFVERYGDSVLMEPPRRGFGLLVWVAPVVVLLAGALLLGRLSRNWLRRRRSPIGVESLSAVTAPHRNGSVATSDDSDTSPIDRARAEFEQFRREA